MFGLISACAFAASVPTIIAKRLKLLIRAYFMICPFLDDKPERTLIPVDVNVPGYAR
jgi:hypothetical protein